MKRQVENEDCESSWASIKSRVTCRISNQIVKANKQNYLMGADPPLFRGPGHGCFCCDWSVLFYGTRPSTWRFSGLFIPALPQACWNQWNYLAKKVLSRNQMPRSWSLEGNNTTKLLQRMKSWVLLEKKVVWGEINASGFDWMWLVVDFKPVLTSWAYLELLHFSCQSQPDPRHEDSFIYLFVHVFL